MNDQNWLGQQYAAMQQGVRASGTAGYWPKTAKDILAYAKDQAQRRRDAIQKELDGMAALRDELANLDALIARFEGKEDE